MNYANMEEFLLKDLRNLLLFIQVEEGGNYFSYPATLKKDERGGTSVPKANKGELTVWDYVRKEYLTLKTADIRGYSYSGDKDALSNSAHTQKKIVKLVELKEKLETLSKSNKNVYKTLYRDKVSDDLKLLMLLFGLEKSDDLDDPDFKGLKKARTFWKSKIKARKEEIVSLLEEEKSTLEETDTEASEELDLVISDLNKVVSSLKLSDLTTLRDLINYWPPMLLPAPLRFNV